MAQITLTIPSEYVARVVAALKVKYFELMPPGTGTGGMTDPQLAKEALRKWIIQSVREFERREAINDIVLNTPDDMVGGTVVPPPK